MKKLLTLALLTSALLSVHAQTTAQADATNAPTTKLEAFSSKVGIVVIKGFTTVGRIQGRGTLSVDAREFRDASNPKQAEYGVVIEIEEPGRLERKNRSFIDYEEIDSLIRGIDYIAKTSKVITTMADFEAEYRTKGSFAVTVFSDQSGNLSLAASTGRIGKTTAFLQTADLEKLKSLLGEAKTTIERAKSSAR